MKTKLGPFKGINNVDEEVYLRQDELRESDNLDVTDRGVLKTRPGYALVQAGNFHSLFEAGGLAYVVKDGNLSVLRSDGSTTDLIQGVGKKSVVTYAKIGKDVAFSDGVSTGVISGQHTGWLGVPTPQRPSLTVTTDGSMSEGVYAVRITFLDRNGEESGASKLATQLVPANSGLVVSWDAADIPDGVGTVSVYSSAPNGEVLYHVGDVDIGTTSIAIPAKLLSTSELQTENLSPMPAGTIIGASRGRLLVAKGNVLWFSEPLRYGLTRLTRNYIQFEDDVIDGEPVEDGWYISTATSVFFLSGKDIQSSSIDACHNVPAVKGTMKTVDAAAFGGGENSGDVVIWLSGKGFMLGPPGGKPVELNRRKFSAPIAESGTISLLEGNGLSKVLCSMKGAGDMSNNVAVGDRVTATVKRNGTIIPW